MPLPNPVIVDLFDIEYKPSRTAIDHIADVVESHGFSVNRIDNFDVRIWYRLLKEGTDLSGDLIVDRMSRTFEISADCDDQKYAALATKDFDLIEDYLKLLSKDLNSE
jgi:hypothetical protein